MGKSLIYIGTQRPQVLADGDKIDLGIVLRKYGSNIKAEGGNAALVGQGYYEINSRFDLTADEAGTAIITLYKDGSPIPSGVAKFTTVADATFSVCIPAYVRNYCCGESTVYATLTGVDGTIASTGTTITKVI